MWKSALKWGKEKGFTLHNPLWIKWALFHPFHTRFEKPTK